MAVVGNLVNKACYAGFLSESQIGNKPKQRRKAGACAVSRRLRRRCQRSWFYSISSCATEYVIVNFE